MDRRVSGRNTQRKQLERRRRNLKKRRRKRVISWILIILISLIPVSITVYLKLLFLPLLAFDVIWFAGTLITFIWTYK